MDEDIHLLYVDKSRTAHRLFENAVSQVAYITCVSSMQEALDAVGTGAFNFIVSDFELPDGDGLELAKALRAGDKHAETPMILYTAGLNNELAYNAMQAGYHDSMQKPMEMMDLTERIVKLVEVPEIKRVQRKLVQMGCVSWESGGRHFEYSPDLNLVMHGAEAEHVSECMQQRLNTMMETSRVANEAGVDPIEAMMVKHVVHFDM